MDLTAWLALALAVTMLMWIATLAAWRRLRRTVKDLSSSRQSQAVRHGQAIEQFVPLMAAWPWDPNRFRFLGDPIDGIQFTDDEVVLVEVKTGTSRLNAAQRRVRDLVQAGRVRWEEVRIR